MQKKKVQFPAPIWRLIITQNSSSGDLMPKRHGHKTRTWYAYIHTSKTRIHIKQAFHCCTKQMVASGHLCREDCQEEEIQPNAAVKVHEATEKGHCPFISHENGGEKQGEKQVCTSRGIGYTGIGVRWKTHCPQLHHGNRPDCGPQQRAGSVCGEKDWDVRGRKGFSHRLGG